MWNSIVPNEILRYVTGSYSIFKKKNLKVKLRTYDMLNGFNRIFSGHTRFFRLFSGNTATEC